MIGVGKKQLWGERIFIHFNDQALYWLLRKSNMQPARQRESFSSRCNFMMVSRRISIYNPQTDIKRRLIQTSQWTYRFQSWCIVSVRLNTRLNVCLEQFVAKTHLYIARFYTLIACCTPANSRTKAPGKCQTSRRWVTPGFLSLLFPMSYTIGPPLHRHCQERDKTWFCLAARFFGTALIHGNPAASGELKGRKQRVGRRGAAERLKNKEEKK